ncbi:MAG: DUF1843 domain-containing protein [Bacteroidota bacterium]
MGLIPLYASSIHKATASGDLEKMKALVEEAEQWLAEHGNVAAALEALKLEIAKMESNY